MKESKAGVAPIKTIFSVWLLFAVSSQPASAQCKLTEQDLQGEPAVILENSLVRLRVRPAHGGRIDQFVHKSTGKWLTAPSDGCVFADRVWNYAQRGVYWQWTKAVYAHHIERGKDEAAVTLTCRGSVGIGARLTFKKRISLRAGDAAVRADYELKLAHEAMTPQRAGIWWHNRLGVPQEATTYYVPTKNGISSLTYGAGASGQYWSYDLSRGWAAALGEEGTGVVAVMDERKLMCVYHLLRGEVGLMEWAYRSEQIPNGESTKTTIWLVPFTGLKAVSGAGSTVVGEIAAPEKITAAQGKAGIPLTVRLVAPRRWKAAVRLTSQKMPAGEIRELSAWTAELSNDRVAEKQVTVKFPEEGSHKLRVEVLSGKELAADLIAMTVVGKASGELVIAPLRKPLGRTGEKFEDKIAAADKPIKDVPPSEEIVTPHIKWAKPLATGKLKTLIINDTLIERETIELAQRVDMEYTAPTVGSYSQISNARLPSRGLSRKQAQSNIARHLKKDYDVVVVGGVIGSIFTDASAETLVKKVKEGMGLVWANPNSCPSAIQAALAYTRGPWGSRAINGKWKALEDHFLTRGIPWEALPTVDLYRYDVEGKVLATAGEVPLMVVRELGEGRIVLLTYATSWQGPGFHKNGLTPWVQFAPTKFDYWEYYFSLLAKCMIWAGQKEPAVQIASLEAQASQLNLQLTNSGKAVDIRVRLSIQDEYGRKVRSDPLQQIVKKGETRLDIPLPRLYGGLHLADIRLENTKGAKFDWATIPIRVQAPVMIEKLKVADNIYRKGDIISAQVTLKKGEGAPKEVKLHTALTDAYGRLVMQSERSVLTVTSPVEISFKLPEPLATTAQFRVEVHDAKSFLHAAEQKILTVPPSWDSREWGPYVCGLWGNPAGAYSREYLAKHQAARVKDIGVDSIMTTGRWTLDGEQRQPFEMGLRTFPIGVTVKTLSPEKRGAGYLSFKEQKTKYLQTRDKKYLVRPWCLNAEDTRTFTIETIKKFVPFASRYRPLGYVCGDELSVTDHIDPLDYDFGPKALSAFRKWLKEEYGELSALNKTWNTSFADWDAVMPMTAEEVAHRGNYAPWADHRTFMEISLSEFLEFTDAELEKLDPGARLGTSGTQAASAYGGYDWWRLSHAFDFLQAYDHQNTGEMQRSFTGMLAASWWGYYARGPGLQHQLWRRLLNGNRGGFYFAARDFLLGDFTFYRTATEGMEYVREFKNGLARLLHGSERSADVTIHYSQPSIHGAFITRGQGLFKHNRAGWFKIIEDLGLQAKFISYVQIETGSLEKTKPKVFILPYSVALSDAEATALRRYVESGGTLIADARTGLLDEHCAPRKTGALDELFGIDHTDMNPMKKRIPGDAVFSGSFEAFDPRSIKFQEMSGEIGVKATDGKALGTLADSPILIMRNVGKGRAVLLNMFLNNYGRRRKLGTGDPLRQLVSEVFKLAGTAPAIETESPEGDHFYTARFMKGEASFAGILREPGTVLTGGGPGQASTGKAPKLSKVVIRFARKGHVYDQRAGKYLGRTNRTESFIAPGDCKVYSVLPYRARSLKVSLDRKTVLPGDEVNYSIRLKSTGKKPGYHVFRIEVSAPDGERRWYGTQLSSDNGQANSSFQLALNDMPGRWRITSTDVATGISDETRFTVRKPR